MGEGRGGEQAKVRNGGIVGGGRVGVGDAGGGGQGERKDTCSALSLGPMPGRPHLPASPLRVEPGACTCPPSTWSQSPGTC